MTVAGLTPEPDGDFPVRRRLCVTSQTPSPLDRGDPGRHAPGHGRRVRRHERDTAAAATTAGCGKAPTLTSGTHTIQSGGKNRSYILRVPANYDNNHPYRLIFGFHWLGGTANDVDSGGTDGYNWSYYGLRRLADSANNSTIFVAPQGISNGWANSGGQDVTFIDDMIRQIEAGLCVDTTQLFSVRFQLRRRDVATRSPAPGRRSSARSRSTPARTSAGAAAGPSPSRTSGSTASGTTSCHRLGRSLRDTFVRNNGCTAQNPPEPAHGSLTHIVTAYSGCRAGYPVVWAAFDGGPRPGPMDGVHAATAGADLDQAGVVWNFFTQFQGGSSPDSADDRPADRRRPASRTSDRGWPVGPLPRRRQLEHEQRHPGAAVGLQRRQQPAVDLHRPASNCRSTATSAWTPAGQGTSNGTP